MNAKEYFKASINTISGKPFTDTFIVILMESYHQYKLSEITEEKIREIIAWAYNWGRDNGSNKSDKNLNDFLQTSTYKDFLKLLKEQG